MKKKIVALLLCVCMAASVTACSNSKNDGSVEDTELTGSTEVGSYTPIDYDANDYVTLGEYTGLAVELTKSYEVTDAEVAEYVNTNVIANYPYYTDSDKTDVETGDFVNLDYTGTKDGVAFDGGTATGYTLEIGSGGFIDGFEDGMIGMKVGEEKDINLTFPENYSSTELAGQDVVFHVKVNKIQEKQDITYDNLSEEYVTFLCEQTGMEYANKDAMVEDINAYLESSNESSRDSEIRSAVLTQLAENCTVDGTPQEVIDARVAQVLGQYESYYCSDGTKLEDYVAENFNMEYADFLEEITTEVTGDVETQMILEVIADKEGIEFVQEEFDTYVSNMVSNNGFEDATALYENYASTAAEGEDYLKKVFVCNQALQKVVDSAVVTVAESATETSTESESATE